MLKNTKREFIDLDVFKVCVSDKVSQSWSKRQDLTQMKFVNDKSEWDLINLCRIDNDQRQQYWKLRNRLANLVTVERPIPDQKFYKF